MSDESFDRKSIEETLRSIAQEVSRSVERVSQTDLDDLVRAVGVDPDRARQWLDDAGDWVRAQAEALSAPGGFPAPDERVPARPTTPVGDDPLRGAAPHPLDVPTDEQGLALAALASGRWTVEPGTSALASRGEGPGPRDALGLVRELRVRDWIDGDGDLTLVGHRALGRWLERAERG